jgi:hypothetical protein
MSDYLHTIPVRCHERGCGGDVCVLLTGWTASHGTIAVLACPEHRGALDGIATRNAPGWLLRPVDAGALGRELSVDMRSLEVVSDGS